MSGRVRIVEGDLVEQDVDALVNAANSALQPGGGVAGAIAERAGPAVQAECDALAPIAVGGAVATGAGALPARCLIHAASLPPGGAATEESLRSAFRRSLEIARERGFRTLAAPALGAGAAGLPLQRCAEILLDEARAHLAAGTSLEEIRFVLAGEPAFRLFESVHDAIRIAEQASGWSRS